MNIKKVLIVSGLSVLFAGASVAATQADYADAVAAARTAQKAAAVAKGEWRDTGKLLKKADAMAKKGDYATAIKLANAAKHQGHLGAQQAKEQIGAGNSGYLYH